MNLLASRRGRSRPGAVLAVSLLFAALAPARGLADEDVKARAQQLFKEGVQAMDKGDTATGCAKLRESLGLFTVANTLFNVAKCDEQEGKLGSALEHWQRGLALIDAKDKRAPVAKDRIAELEPRAPRMRIVVPVGQGPTTVVLDGRELEAKALDAPLVMDPGKHVMLIQVEGRKERRHELTLAEKERTEVVATGGPPEEKKEPAGSLSGGGPAGSGTTAKTPDASSGKGLRTAGFVVLGLGVAGGIAAGVTSYLYKTQHDDLKGYCDAHKLPNPCAVTGDLQTSASKSGPLVIGNAVAWGVGAAGISAGLVMVLVSARSGKSRETAVAPFFVGGGGGLTMTGRF
jgi:hypothetical protein